MRSTTAQSDVAAPARELWAALTSPARTRQYLAGLSITSRWEPDAGVDAYQGRTLIATGVVVVACEPRLLVYRLDDPATADIDCWLTWQLDQSGPDLTRVTLTADTLPADPAIDAVRLVSSLKTHVETNRRRNAPADPSALARTIQLIPKPRRRWSWRAGRADGGYFVARPRRWPGHPVRRSSDVQTRRHQRMMRKASRGSRAIRVRSARRARWPRGGDRWGDTARHILDNAKPGRLSGTVLACRYHRPGSCGTWPAPRSPPPARPAAGCSCRVPPTRWSRS